jgi:hypothetical protein
MPDIKLREVLEKGRCREVGFTEAWFPDYGGNQSPGWWAKRVCDGCEVRQQCLEYAVENNEWGIWGGTLRDERPRPERETEPEE